LKDYPGLVFDGNREGRDIVRGNFEVMVSDGFAGNIAIKTIEGTGEFIFSLMKEKLLANPIRKIGTLLIKPALKELNKTLDYHEYGGAPLVGLSGISIVCHGSSNARAIESAIEIAAKCIETGFNEKIAETLANI
jgi:glycerol-3-phosphate acyltransferase PlsX